MNIVSFLVVVFLLVAMFYINTKWVNARTKKFIDELRRSLSLHKEHEVLLKLEKAGLNEELSQKIIESKGNVLAKKMIEAVTATVGSSPALKYLKPITNSIPIATQPFQRDSFFKNGPVKLYLWDSFKDLILKAIPDLVPAFQGNLRSTQLSKNMYDSEILTELGHPKPFSLLEFTAILSHLLMKQPEGEEGKLLVNGYATIFYVELEDGRVVAVYAGWRAGARAWSLRAFAFGAGFWYGGDRVFSRS